MGTASWILAFDASCCQCGRMAEQVERAGRGRLDIKPLDRPDVAAWRTRVFGDHPPHAPTLIVTGPDGTVRAWTGMAMAVRLARRLGPRGTLRLLGAIGALRAGTGAPEGGMRRGQFLRLAGAGAVAVVLGTAAPASADSRTATAAQRWVQANRGNLPRDYATFAAHDLAHRKEIFRALPAATRGGLWREQLTTYRAAHPDLTGAQRTVLASAIALAGDPAIFTGRVAPGSDTARRTAALADRAIAAFGRDDAHALIATLGPEQRPLAGDCDCNVYYSQWCDNLCYGCLNCPCSSCACSSSGCGTLWVHECNGNCQ